MPPIVVASIIGAGAAAGTTALGARAQGRAQKRALNASTAADTRALDFEREQDAKDRAEFDRELEERRRQWDEQQRLYEDDKTEERRRYGVETATDNARYADKMGLERDAIAREEGRYGAEQSRREPYRGASRAALGDLMQNIGVSLRPSDGAPPGVQPMPPPRQRISDLYATGRG